MQRTNDELIANWGNLAHRTLTTAYRNFGQVPAPAAVTADDQATLARVQAGFGSVGAHIEAARFRAALAAAMEVSAAVNQYLTRHEPWKLVKTDRERAGTFLYVALQSIADLRLLFAPFLPFTSQNLHEQLGFSGSLGGDVRLETRADAASAHEVITGNYERAVGRWERTPVPPRQRLAEPRALFRKLDEAIIDSELARMASS